MPNFKNGYIFHKTKCTQNAIQPCVIAAGSSPKNVPDYADDTDTARVIKRR